MAARILNGFDGAATVKIDGDDYKCVIGAWSASFAKTYYSTQTFCSGPWQDEEPGILSMSGSATGFLSEDDAISDPLQHFEQSAVPLVLQATDLSKISLNAHVESDLSASANSAFGLGFRFRSKGVVARIWKTTP